MVPIAGAYGKEKCVGLVARSNMPGLASTRISRKQQGSYAKASTALGKSSRSGRGCNRSSFRPFLVRAGLDLKASLGRHNRSQPTSARLQGVPHTFVKIIRTVVRFSISSKMRGVRMYRPIMAFWLGASDGLGFSTMLRTFSSRGSSSSGVQSRQP